jgi:hypothetical protein
MSTIIFIFFLVIIIFSMSVIKKWFYPRGNYNNSSSNNFDNGSSYLDSYSDFGVSSISEVHNHINDGNSDSSFSGSDFSSDSGSFD